MQPTIIQQCPVCSRVLTFSSTESNIITCSACGSTINRNDDGALVAKPHYTTMLNPGIIQPGTTGIWNSKPFTVLGRFRAWYEESLFNYWTIQFPDGEIQWLAEGYGIYSILMPSKNAKIVTKNDLDRIDFGERRELGFSRSFVLMKKYKATKIEVEAELLIPDNESTLFELYELYNPEGVNLAYFEFKKKIVAYEIIYTSFDVLKLSNLREHIITPKTFPCSKCKATLTIKSFPFAQSCACNECGTQYALNNGMDFKIIRTEKQENKLAIPLGSTGKIEGINYEVIGFVQKEEVNMYHSRWREYTLYNPQEGYAFLSEYDGNWTYVRENPNCPVLLHGNEKEFDLNDKSWELFNSYSYKVINACGEFPYNIYDNSKTRVREYISPPEIWIQEWDPVEGITWFLGRHITGKQIITAFDSAVLPWKKGVGAAQPLSSLPSSDLFRATAVALLALIVIHFGIAFSKKGTRLFDKTIFFGTTDQITLVTEKYTLDKYSSNIRFDIEANVNNSWFELSATLVNAQTGKEYSLEQGVEYYHGYTDGENWTEGSTSQIAYFTRIPAGTYFLQLMGTRESNSLLDAFKLAISYDVPTHRNFWWALAILLICPIVMSIYVHYGEKIRWGNSPYNPYSTE